MHVKTQSNTYPCISNVNQPLKNLNYGKERNSSFSWQDHTVLLKIHNKKELEFIITPSHYNIKM